MSEIQRYIEIIEKLNIKIQEEQAKVQELEAETERLGKETQEWYDEVQFYKAKVQELEERIDNTFLIGKATSNQIKANAIEEMLIHFGLFDLDKDKHGFGEYLAELREGER